MPLGSGAVSSKPSVIPFSPSLLPGLAAWWDASDTATITVAGGNAVTAWTDKSGNGRTLGNVGGLGPQSNTTTVNGRNALLYANSNQQLGMNSAFIYALGDCTIFVVGHMTNVSATFIGEGRSSSGNGIYQVSANGTASRFYHETDAGTLLFERLGGNLSSGIRITVVDTVTNAKITDSAGGNSNVNYTRGTFTPDRLGVGCLRRNGTAGNMNGKLCEIIVCDSALSAPNIANTEVYLNTKWGF